MAQAIEPRTTNRTRDNGKLLFELGPLWMLAAVLSCLPYVLIYLKNLWELPHYQFFPLLIAAVAYLGWQRWGGRYAFTPTLRGRLFHGLVVMLFVGGCFGALCATAFASPWMGYFGFACCLTSWFAYHRDKETDQSLFYLGLPVALIWQPPYDSIRTADTILIQELQSISARLSSKWLDTFGYLHFQPGTVLEIPGKSFGVAEACSGIQSFFAVLCVGALLIAVQRRGPLHGLLLLLTSPFWAVLMNTIRITLIPIAYELFGLDLAHGLLHDLLGYGTMALAIGLMLSTDELLVAFFGWLSKTRRARKAVGEAPMPATAPPLNWLKLAPALIVFGGFFGIQLFDTVESWSVQRKVVDFFRDEPLIEMSLHDMPKDLRGWPMLNYDQTNRGPGNDDMGERSDMWYYGAPFGRVTASFDQMFPGWHELTRCYRNSGWKPTQRIVYGRDEGYEWPMVAVDMTRADEHGYLVFSLKTRGGKPIQPPGAFTYWTVLQERLRGRLTPAVRGALFGTAAYQQQMFSTTAQPLPEAAKQEIFQRFLTIRETLWAAAETHMQEWERQ
ncbi:MAG: exosortase U [bacterium]|nr:exosortase U [bacterium]